MENQTEKLLQEISVPFETFSICFSEEKYYRLIFGCGVTCFVYHVDRVYSTKLFIRGSKFSYRELGYPESWFVKKHKNKEALALELVQLRDLISVFKEEVTYSSILKRDLALNTESAPES